LDEGQSKLSEALAEFKIELAATPTSSTPIIISVLSISFSELGSGDQPFSKGRDYSA